jgi:hypothetical protein
MDHYTCMLVGCDRNRGSNRRGLSWMKACKLSVAFATDAPLTLSGYYVLILAHKENYLK